MRSISNCLTSIFYSLGGVLFVVMNIWIKEYRLIFLIEMIAISLVALNLLFLCRTPFYLHEAEKYGGLFKALSYIAWWNKREDDAEKIKEHFTKLHQQPHSKQQAIDTTAPGQDLDIDITVPHHEYKFTLKTLKKTLCYTIVTANIYLGYGMTLLIPDKMGITNIYLNGVLLGVSEMFAAIISSFIAHKVKRKSLNMFHCFNTLVVAGLLLSIQFFGFKETNGGKITESCLSMLVKLTVCISMNLIFTYGSELFHTKYRGFIIAIAVFSGNIMISLASYMDTVASRWSIHPMIMLSVSSCVTMAFILLLPETLNKKISN